MSKNFRSAISGRYVKPGYAKANPKITVGERRSKPTGSSGKGKGKKG